MLTHNLLKEYDPIHPRHFQIEGDDIGRCSTDNARGGKCIRRRPHDIEIGIALYNSPEGLTNQGGIVNNQDLDTFPTAHELNTFCKRLVPHIRGEHPFFLASPNVPEKDTLRGRDVCKIDG